MIRFTGTDFEGYVGLNWHSFTGGGSSFWQQTGNVLHTNNEVGIGTITMVGSADFTVKDLDSNNFGGMYVQTSGSGNKKNRPAETRRS